MEPSSRSLALFLEEPGKYSSLEGLLDYIEPI